MTPNTRSVATRLHAGAAARPSSRAPPRPNQNWFHRFTGPLGKGPAGKPVDYLASAAALELALLNIANNPSDQLIVLGLDGVLAPFHAGDGLPKVPGHIYDLLQRLGASGMRIVILTGRPPWEAQKMLTSERPVHERTRRNYDIVGLHGAMTLRGDADEAVLLKRLEGTEGGPEGFIRDQMNRGRHGRLGADSLAYPNPLSALLKSAPTRQPQIGVKPDRTFRETTGTTENVELLAEGKPYSVALFTVEGQNEEAGEKVLDGLIQKAKYPPYQLTPFRLVRGAEFFPSKWTTKALRLLEIIKDSGAKSVTLFDDDFAGAEAMEELDRIRAGGTIEAATFVPVYQPRGPHKRFMDVSKSALLGGPPQVEDSLAFVADNLPKAAAVKRK